MNEEDIKNMSDQELSKLVAAISAERKVREARASGLVHITFESSFVDTRKAKGWAAQLITSQDVTIERKFIETTRNWSKGGYNFWFEGHFEAGAILEICNGGSWKNQYRGYYEVDPAAEDGLRYIGDVERNTARKYVFEKLGTSRFAAPKRPRDRERVNA
jgi:hypothetical protein